MLAFIQIFCQNRFIKNMLERKKLKSWNHGVSESRSFLVRCSRKTYVLKKYILFIYKKQRARERQDGWGGDISVPRIFLQDHKRSRRVQKNSSTPKRFCPWGIKEKRGAEYLIITKERLVLPPIRAFFTRGRNILF